MGKKYTGRFYAILIIMLVLMSLLIWKLHYLTMKQGQYYRNLADEKRIKEVEINAPRGNIYDRNGKLLAGTRTSFAVQGYKDELMDLKPEERNETLLKLVRFLERDGCSYLNSFPISVNEFSYDSIETYFSKEETPREYAERLLIENDLVYDWVSLIYEDSSHPENKVSVAARALNAMSMKGAPLPINIDPDNNYNLSYEKNDKFNELVSNNKIKDVNDPLQLIADEVKSNESLMSQVMDHPACRELGYRILSDKGLAGNLRLTKYSYTYETDYLQRKASLHHAYPEILQRTSAKDDFTTIVKTSALTEFLQSVGIGEKNEFLIPAENLLNSLSSLGIETNLTYKISDDASSVSIEYEKTEETLELPIDRLKRLGEENHLIDDLISNDKYKELAQTEMFKKGIYPRISIYDWNYGLEKDQSDFVERYELKKKTAEEAFQILKKEYEIKVNCSEIECLGILVITNEIESQGSYAYAPLNLAYELSDVTVAKFEENIPKSTGIVISKEPIRYYPNGDSACHILGYIGKIATDYEIETYVKKKGYQYNELIGKSGVEESFEDTLHGVSGKEIVAIDSYGNRTETLQRIEPKAGNNLYLTIDIDFQKQSEDAVERGIKDAKSGSTYYSKWGNISINQSNLVNSGASVSIDPNTGELLAMVSYPGYDPNLFVTGISNSDWMNISLSNDTNQDAAKPLMNIAMQTAVQPGSIFKTVTALAGLEKGLDPEATVNCQGYMEIGTEKFACYIYNAYGGYHGPVNLYDAIGDSCNYYFFSLGLGMDPRGEYQLGVKVDIEDIQEMVKKLGLDKRSGIEINFPSESESNVPSKEGKLDISIAMTKIFLNNDLAKYKKPGVFKNQSDYADDIREIVSWMEETNQLSRSEIIDKLEEMGYHGEQPLDGSNTNLADILKYSYFNQASWTTADTLNSVIGQGSNSYTPLTISTLVSTLANGGMDYDVTIVKEIRTHDDSVVIFENKPKGHSIELNDMSHIQDVREGMRRVVDNTGASDAFKILGFDIGSKTGTAERDGYSENGQEHKSYAWYMAFAPFDSPKIATVTFIPEAGKSLNSVAVTRDVLASFFKIPIN